MSTDCQPGAATATLLVDTTPIPRRRVDRIDEPARPLGPKRAALQLRRLQRSPTPAPAKLAPEVVCASRRDAVLLASKAGDVSFSLRATDQGCLVERTQRQAVGARLVQTMVFADQATFERWCAVEPIRFEDPVLYDQLRREGHGALDGKR